MRILVDECLDERLRSSFSGHDCQTARYAGFAGLKNGELLNVAESARFEVLLTADQGLEYEQNLNGPQDRHHHFSRKIDSPKRPAAAHTSLFSRPPLYQTR